MEFICCYFNYLFKLQSCFRKRSVLKVCHKKFIELLFCFLMTTSDNAYLNTVFRIELALYYFLEAVFISSFDCCCCVWLHDCDVFKYYQVFVSICAH